LIRPKTFYLFIFYYVIYNNLLGWQVVYGLETAHDIFNGTLAPQVSHLFLKKT